MNPNVANAIIKTGPYCSPGPPTKERIWCGCLPKIFIQNILASGNSLKKLQDWGALPERTVHGTSLANDSNAYFRKCHSPLKPQKDSKAASDVSGYTDALGLPISAKGQGSYTDDEMHTEVSYSNFTAKKILCFKYFNYSLNLFLNLCFIISFHIQVSGSENRHRTKIVSVILYLWLKSHRSLDWDASWFPLVPSTFLHGKTRDSENFLNPRCSLGCLRRSI